MAYLVRHDEGAVFRIHQEAAESGFNSDLGARLSWAQILTLLLLSHELVT